MLRNAKIADYRPLPIRHSMLDFYEGFSEFLRHCINAGHGYFCLMYSVAITLVVFNLLQFYSGTSTICILLQSFRLLCSLTVHFLVSSVMGMIITYVTKLRAAKLNALGKTT